MVRELKSHNIENMTHISHIHFYIHIKNWLSPQRLSVPGTYIHQYQCQKEYSNIKYKKIYLILPN